MHPLDIAGRVRIRGRGGTAEQALASRAARIAERARRLDPATLSASDRVTHAVVIHAAGSVADSISARILEHTVSDTFTSPSHDLLASLPLVPVSRALGDRFDIRAFHDAVLGGGALPLAVLADVVADWIAAVR